HSQNGTGLTARLVFLISCASPLEAVAHWKGLRREVLHRSQCGAGRGSSRRTAVNRDRPTIIITRDYLRANDITDIGDRAHRNHRAGLAAHMNLPDILDVAPILCLTCDIDLPRTSEQVKVVNEKCAKR